MKKLLPIIIVLFVFGCKDKIISPSTVIGPMQIDNKSPYADGSTIINIAVTLNSQADADKHTVIFSTSAGMFIPGTDTTITVTANYEKGQLIARAKFQVPQVPGTLIIKATPTSQNAHNTYQILDTLTVQPSLPASLVLLPSSLGISSGFTKEVSMTATLKNTLKNKVSVGSKVQFDQVMINGMPISGVFRTQTDTTDATSTATATYTAGNTPAGTRFYLKCTYIDSFENPSLTVKDSVLINVTN